MEFEDVSTYRPYVTWLVIWYRCFLLCFTAWMLSLSPFIFTFFHYLFWSWRWDILLLHLLIFFFFFHPFFQYATTSRLCGLSWYTQESGVDLHSSSSGEPWASFSSSQIYGFFLFWYSVHGRPALCYWKFLIPFFNWLFQSLVALLFPFFMSEFVVIFFFI